MEMPRDQMVYRDSTIAVIVDADRNFLLVNKSSYQPDEWNFAGGGVDQGETPERAVVRELTEELGSESFKVLGQSRNHPTYEFPDAVVLTNYSKRGVWQRGQRLTQFMVEFDGDKKSLTAEDGIRAIKWVTRDQLPEHLVFPGQWANAQGLLLEFGL